jgi:CelD/BcsL family acetyltransferase involved in cellulose biosynthesis
MRTSAKSANLEVRGTSSVQYELDPLSKEEQETWDARIADYESTHLFHRRAWLDYLAESQGVEIRHWAIKKGGRTVGYFCAGIFNKGPFRILGSPLKSWGTNFMGPVVNSDFCALAFLRALDDLAASEGIAMLEIENPILGTDLMASRGYDVKVESTYIIKLTPHDEDLVWERIDKKDHSTVRKARRVGLTVVESSDVSMTDEYYDQFMEVMTRKGLFPPYDRDRPRLLFEHLYPKDMLLALRILDPEGQPIATGLFPHDDKTIYYWGGASRLAGRQYSPNDLMHWSVMEWALKRGLTAYNMCGPGKFKQKFGGVLVPIRRWQKYYSNMARWGRAAYARYHGVRIRVLGRWGRLTQAGGEAH